MDEQVSHPEGLLSRAHTWCYVTSFLPCCCHTTDEGFHVPECRVWEAIVQAVQGGVRYWCRAPFS